MTDVPSPEPAASAAVDATRDSTLAAAVERLKAGQPKTRELYREVCALMFDRFGIRPTPNGAYQLVKRGSMTTVTEVVNAFWDELREKNRARIARPDLPPELQEAAGELMAALWAKSNAAAQAALEALRDELDAERDAGREEIALARAAAARVEATLAERETALLAAQSRIQELGQALAGSEASRRALEGDVARVQAELGRRDAALVQARADFAQELDKLRDAAQRSEARLQAAEKRALLEIERERAIATQLKKELDATVRRAEQREEQHRAEAEGWRTQVGDARQQVGLVQGRLDAADAARAVDAHEIDSLRQRLAAVLASRTPGSARARRARKGPALKTLMAPIREPRRAKPLKP